MLNRVIVFLVILLTVWALLMTWEVQSLCNSNDRILDLLNDQFEVQQPMTY